jgi:outer membrane protein assembly factor BamB
MGRLRCLSLKDGKRVWERDTYDEFNEKRPHRGEPPEGYFGLGTSPIVEGDKLLLNVGGAAKGAGVVAFALKDGEVAWKSSQARASYSSPVAADIAGVRQVIFATRFEVLSLDPQNGAVRWQFPFGRPGPNVTAANPLVIGGHVFVSASYGFGAAWAKAGKESVEIVWQQDDLLSSQYTTGIVLQRAGGGPAIVGIHGRQDVGTASLRCIDPAAAKVLWEQPQFGYATLIAADGKLLILGTDGELVLASASAEKYEELARAAVLTGTARALPALAGGLLYVRDEGTLKCLDLRERGK